MEKQIIIYGLCHPITEELRYVGMTSQSLSTRLNNHLRRLSSKNPTYCQSWIKSLKKENLKPEIFELDTVSYNEWEFWEQW